MEGAEGRMRSGGGWGLRGWRGWGGISGPRGCSIWKRRDTNERDSGITPVSCQLLVYIVESTRMEDRVHHHEYAIHKVQLVRNSGRQMTQILREKSRRTEGEGNEQHKEAQEPAGAQASVISGRLLFQKGIFTSGKVLDVLFLFF